VPTSRNGPDPRLVGFDAPLQPTEINDGLVRVRTRTDGDPAIYPSEFFVGSQGAGP